MTNKFKSIGYFTKNKEYSSKEYIHQYIKLRLESLGLLDDSDIDNDYFFKLAKGLISNYKERSRSQPATLCAVDQRIQNFIDSYFADVNEKPSLAIPTNTFTLDFYGIAREMSLPDNRDEYFSDYISSYRVKQGVLHNPRNDRRTTKGVFHIAEGGLPIPDDKKSVPKLTAAMLLSKAMNEKGDIMSIPFTMNSSKKANCFVSLLLRPIVVPEVEGISPEKSMEVRFFAPGSLVSNLDFVESIFGNAGSPYMLANDAGLDTQHWTGHTGCIILAPQLTKLTKKEVGLPNIKDATEREKRDGMCWEKPEDLYNDGQSFKISMRTDEGVIVTVIADNYFGYSKKEVKTFISYAANLFGNAEEEHAGGALVFPSYNQGELYMSKPEHFEGRSMEEVARLFPDVIEMKPEGYGVDKNYSNIIYVPELTTFEVQTQKASWKKGDEEHSLKILPRNTYILPNGIKFRMERVPGTLNYRLVETHAEGVFIHKPCTVSGGGKSEISKSIGDSIFGGSFFIKDFDKDFEKVAEIINFDYSARFKGVEVNIPKSRNFLSNRRSMGSAIKMLTPSADFTDQYNKWLEAIPQYIKGIAFIVKRFYRVEWGDNWKQFFSVDVLNGQPGNELKYLGRKVNARYLRVGFAENDSWRTFKLRQDYVPAEKLQIEDDITASTVVSTSLLSNLNHYVEGASVKIVSNCEYRFFQRPDDAIHRGFDKKAESDLSSPNTFISNFEPLTIPDAIDMTEDVIHFDMFTKPMRDLIEDVAYNQDANYFVSSANPRIVDGKPSKNVRYLQTRDDITNPINKYIAEMSMRIARKVSTNTPLYTPVNCVLPGRRNNPAEKGIKPLSVYSPIHYQELPELFMDFISSLTGKSPSTTGAGSEGALTKSPFNALLPITDLNNALVSFILTGYNGFSTPAGYIGHKFRVDHDISLLVPELWSRLQPFERDPKLMLENGFLEKIEDFEHGGKKVRASILGYRITSKFVNTYFGRVFENPNVVFTNDMLKPELQSMKDFVDGVNNIVESQQKVALSYFKDGSIEGACPPMKALLTIMAYGEYEGKKLFDSEIRDMFTLEYLENSDWYKARLIAKQQYDINIANKNIRYIEQKIADNYLEPEIKRELKNKLEAAKQHCEYVCSYDYLKSLSGTIGRDIIKK